MSTATEPAIDAEFTEERSLVRTESQPLSVLPTEMSPEVFAARIERDEQMRSILKDYVKRNLVEEHHFSRKLGTMTLPKPMLLQEGARNICSLFKLFFGEPRLDETYLEGGHYRVRTHIALFNAEGRQIASGDAVCSTLEPKYAYRTGQRECPECHVPAIMKDNKSANGGFYCWAKKDGCGAKFAADDTRITEQKIGRVDNPDKAELENTVLKMSIKRAKVAAVCDVAMVSEIFAPDVDDAASERGRESATNPEGQRPKTERQQHPHVEPQGSTDERASAGVGEVTTQSDAEHEATLIAEIGELFKVKLGDGVTADEAEVNKFLNGRNLAMMPTPALEKLKGDLAAM